MTNYKTASFVWLGVTTLFQFAQKYTAALSAYGEVYGDGETENAFLDVSHSTLWRQLTVELSKIYDREQTCGEDNLSIQQLRKLCAQHHAFPGGEANEVIRALDNLQTRYEALLPKELRNKKLAHYDLMSAFTQKPPTILFSEVEQFVLDTSKVLASVGECLLVGELQFEYNEFVKRYTEDLYTIQNAKKMDR